MTEALPRAVAYCEAFVEDDEDVLGAWCEVDDISEPSCRMACNIHTGRGRATSRIIECCCDGHMGAAINTVSQEQVQPDDLVFMALFARMDTVAMAAAIAILFALGLAGATVVLLLQGAPPGVAIGRNLSALGNILPGYSASWMGSLIGAAWVGVIGAVTGFLIAAFWNFAHLVFMGLAALSYPRQVTPPVQPLPGTTSLQSDSADRQLLSAVVRLNVCISAIGVGLGLGLLLFVGTNLSLALSQHPGRYLNLLGVFMAGYLVSVSGAWLGLLWGTIYGAILGGALAWLYARSIGARIPTQVTWDNASVRQLRPPLLQISSHALGIGLGAIAALQLIFATVWLVLRGTADESVHAKLLSHYLPGYTVTLQGSLLGGLELFLLVYLSSALIGATYNAVTRYRHEGEVK